MGAWGRAGSTPWALSQASDHQGTAESTGLPSCSQILAVIAKHFWAIWVTLHGSKQIWLDVIRWWESCTRLGASWGAAPCLIPSAGCFSLPNCSPPRCTSWAFAGSCICERISGLRLHLLMEIALTFIFICWPDCYPVPKAECGYTFLLKLACLV